jgi:hypothetical protein
MRKTFYYKTFNRIPFLFSELGIPQV